MFRHEKISVVIFASCQFTDVTIVCDDGSLSTHSAALAGLFSSLGFHFCCNLRTFLGKINFGTNLVYVKCVSFCMSAPPIGKSHPSSNKP